MRPALNSPREYASPSALRNSAVAVLTCAYLVGTGGDPRLEYFAKRQDQGYRFIHLGGTSNVSPAVERLNIRSIVETLDRIREIFKLSVSDLAAACQVSRQAVHKWISGESSSLEAENQNRIDDLYRAAELFVAHGAFESAIFRNRRGNGGRTLVETMRTGHSAQTWALEVLDILAIESRQSAMLGARLSARKRPAPNAEEWGIPMLNENDT
jgi:transcriptional regulator with XRE-family HTH domain